MNERIKELAEQAGWMMGDEVEGFNTRLERFAELVRADEREACIKVIANYSHIWWDWAQFSCKTAAAIRARGEVK